MWLKYIMAFVVFTSCAVKHEVEPTKDVKVEIIIKVDFVNDIKKLCEDSNPVSKFQTIEEYKKVVADCTLDNMSLIDIKGLETISTDLCKDGADLSQFTPEQVISIKSFCEIF